MAYNGFRYYDSQVGCYINQDPVGLEGGMALYRHLLNVNNYIDVFGLAGQRWKGKTKKDDLPYRKPGGNKPYRRMDVSFEDAAEDRYHINVGKILEDGKTGVVRECLALSDVLAHRHKVAFEGYEKNSDYRSKLNPKHH